MCISVCGMGRGLATAAEPSAPDVRTQTPDLGRLDRKNGKCRKHDVLIADFQWRRHGVDWGGHVHPTFARGHS